MAGAAPVDQALGRGPETYCAGRRQSSSTGIPSHEIRDPPRRVTLLAESAGDLTGLGDDGESVAGQRQESLGLVEGEGSRIDLGPGEGGATPPDLLCRLALTVTALPSMTSQYETDPLPEGDPRTLAGENVRQHGRGPAGQW